MVKVSYIRQLQRRLDRQCDRSRLWSQHSSNFSSILTVPSAVLLGHGWCYSDSGAHIQNRLRRVRSLSLRLRLLFLCLQWPCTISSKHRPSQFFRSLHRWFHGSLVTTGIGGSGITSRVANDQGGGRYPYPTRVCALTLGDSFLAHSFVSLVIDHSFLYHLSFIPFQTGSGLFLFHSPPFLKLIPLCS